MKAMTDDAYQVRRTLLDIPEANRLGKWASLWSDLVNADMALHERAQLPNKPSTAFMRRAYWESAIVSYGRMQASGKKRKLEHEDLIRVARGERGIELHEVLMGWRHGHVAHRASGDFEAVRVFADCLDADPETLDSIRVEAATSVGPADDSDEVREFREHIKALRDTLWAEYLAPIGESLAKQTPPGQPMTETWDPPSAADRIAAELVLWSQHDGTSMG